MKPRNPFLVLAWSFGLFLLAYSHQYLYVLLVSAVSGTGVISLLKTELVTPQTLLVKGVIAALIGIPLTLILVKFLWNRDKKWMCSTFNSRLLFYGAILGLILPVVIMAILSLFGVVKIIGSPSRFLPVEIIFILVGSAGYIVFTAILEEFVFRGMALREWGGRYGWITAALLNGFYFGAAHLVAFLPHISPGYFLKTTLLITAANLLFAAMYIRGKSLWLPIGFHTGWNFCLYAVMGTMMSGSDSTLGIFESRLSGPGALTGGNFGVELSLVTLAVYLILAFLFIKLPWRGKPLLLKAKPQP